MRIRIRDLEQRHTFFHCSVRLCGYGGSDDHAFRTYLAFNASANLNKID